LLISSRLLFSDYVVNFHSVVRCPSFSALLGVLISGGVVLPRFPTIARVYSQSQLGAIGHFSSGGDGAVVRVVKLSFPPSDVSLVRTALFPELRPHE
jgi:hypothetical protein